MYRIKNKKYLFIILASIFLTGCWDKVEINERAYVLALGIDQVGENIKVTYAIPNLPVLTGISQSGEANFYKTTEGATLYEANNEFMKISNTQLSFDHTKIIILGSEYLKDGKNLKRLFDYIDRSPDYALSLLIVATDMTADSFIKSKPNSEQVLSMYIYEIFTNNIAQGISYEKITLKDFITNIVSSDGSGYLPIVTYKNEETTLNGMLFVKDYKTCGTLPDEKVKAFSFLKGKGTGSIVSIEIDDIPAPYTISQIKRTVSIKKLDTSLEIDIIIETEGDISEYELGKDDGLYKSDKVKELEEEVKKKMGEETNEVIRFAQMELGIDIFEISDELKIQNGKLWKEVKEVWDDYFSSAKITVEVIPHIRRIGMAK